MDRAAFWLWALAALAACSKTQPVVMPCDTDLGYLGNKIHLANVQFLWESRQVDWFELYDNIENRRTMKPAPNCIPTRNVVATERLIERQEHSLRHLR